MCCINGYSQNEQFKSDVKKLVTSTVDIEDKQRRKMALGFRASREEKEAMHKDYDSVLNTFLGDIEKYYLNKYTHDEVIKMLALFETKGGKRLMYNMDELAKNDFPPQAEWGMQIYKYEKENEQPKKLEVDMTKYNPALVADVKQLMVSMGVYNRAAYTREQKIMWTKPENEQKVINVMDVMEPVFLENSEKYLLLAYLPDQIKEINAFYKTPLGEKMIKANKEYIEVYDEAEGKCSQSFIEILSFEKAGKYKIK